MKSPKWIRKVLLSATFWTFIINTAFLLLYYFVLKDYIPTFNIGTYITIVVAILFNFIVTNLVRFFEANNEDAEKLTEDYDKLTNLYFKSKGMLRFTNNSLSDYLRGRKKTGCKRDKTIGNFDSYTFPVADVIDLRGKKICFSDTKDQYVLPPQAERNLKQFSRIHAFSSVYNSPAVRLKKICESGSSVEFFTERTDYFNSLITNRAMDYKIDGISLRDLLEYTNSITPLDESTLSNHIGYCGMIKTSDKKYIFIKRNKNVSIAKNMLQLSVGASLKCKKALDENGILTCEGFVNSIKEEIVDELSLNFLPQFEIRKEQIFRNLSISNVHYFYRDLLEGGKPQFFFVYDIPLSSSELSNAIDAGAKTAKKERNYFNRFLLTDGSKYIFVDESEMAKIYISPDLLVLPKQRNHKRCHRIIPQHSACLALLRKEIDPLVVDEITCRSKYDKNASHTVRCEDGIYFGRNIIAVIDGATPKKKVGSGLSGGEYAVREMERTLRICELKGCYKDEDILERLSDSVDRRNKKTKRNGKASLIYYNAVSECVVSYGDCGYMTDKIASTFQKKELDDIASNKRSLYIQNHIHEAVAQGKSENEAEYAFSQDIETDFSRKAILQDLIKNEALANKALAEGGYALIDGTKINKELLHTIPLTDFKFLVLGSDGYPTLYGSLKETESKLRSLLIDDPLCYKSNKGTKGVYRNQISYDDRSYVRFHKGK